MGSLAMPTVLMVNHTAVLGGAETSLLELAGALDRVAFCPVVVLPEPGPLAAALGELGIEVAYAPMRRLRRTASPLRLAAQVLSLRRCGAVLRRIAAERQAVLVHSNSNTAHLYAAWALHGRLPLVWHSRDLVSLGPAGRWMFRRATAVVAISESVRGHLVRYADRPDKLVTIPNGIDLTRFRPRGRRAETRARLGLAPEAFAVGMVAHLVAWKRHELFLRAGALLAARMPDLRLVVAGGDPFNDAGGYAAELRALAQRLGLAERVVFTGEDRDPAALLEALDVLVHPAEREPFGRVIVEAMAVGTPVVAVNACGPAEIVRDGIDGLLVPPDSPEALAAAVERLVADGELRSRLVAGGRARAAAAFDVRRVAAQVQALYARLLA